MMASLFTILQISAAFQLTPKLISQVATLAAYPMFEGIGEVQVFTCHAWVSFLDTSTNEVSIFEIRDTISAETPATLRRTQPSSYTVCSSTECSQFSSSLEPFQWTFVSLTVMKGALRLCTREWVDNSILCSVRSAPTAPFTDTCSVSTSTASNELYDFQLVFAEFSDDQLASLASNYICHSVCHSCIGPAPTACNEFLPVVPLTQPLQVRETDYLDYTVVSVPFRGKAYPVVTSLGVTVWTRVDSLSNLGSYSEGFRLWTES